MIVKQGKLNLYGDILTVSSKNNEIKNMIMKGDKAKYNQITKEGKKYMVRQKQLNIIFQKTKLFS